MCRKQRWTRASSSSRWSRTKVLRPVSQNGQASAHLACGYTSPLPDAVKSKAEACGTCATSADEGFSVMDGAGFWKTAPCGKEAVALRTYYVESTCDIHLQLVRTNTCCRCRHCAMTMVNMKWVLEMLCRLRVLWQASVRTKGQPSRVASGSSS